MERLGRRTLLAVRRAAGPSSLQPSRQQLNLTTAAACAARWSSSTAGGVRVATRMGAMAMRGGERQQWARGGWARATAAGLSTKAGEGSGDAGQQQQAEQQAEGSDEGKKEGGQEEGQEQQEGQEDPEPEMPQEKIGAVRGFMYLAAAVLAAGSLYFIIDELMPTRMSANHLFNEAFDAIKANHEVLNRYGEPLKGYGRDGGGRREGRRNFVEHKNYVAEDGTKRLRIRFNIEGPFGHAFVFAEVTSDMKKGEWMYLLVQDLQTGRVLTIEDNRAMHDALGKAKSSEERDAYRKLIGGGSSSGGGAQ